MFKKCILVVCFAAGAYAQEWHVGVIGGYGYSPNFTITNGSTSANAAIGNGPVVGFVIGEDKVGHWGGEARYMYRSSDMQLSSGGVSTTFSSHTHIFNYDVLFYPGSSRESSVRPYIALGAGMKFMQGTGAESATQPLGQFAAFTATNDTMPVGDAGLGVKAQIGHSWQLRIEARDYMGRAPDKIVAPAPGSNVSGWMHDVIGMASLSYSW